MRKMLLINPNAGFNRNIPNIALGYAAAYYENVKVVDLNTMPAPPKRYLEDKADLVGISRFLHGPICEAGHVKP